MLIFIYENGAFLVTCAALEPAPGITAANVRRIRPGMTREEVEALLGGPHHSASWENMRAVWPSPWAGLWRGSDGCVTVVFDPPGRVRGAEFRPDPGRPPGPLNPFRKAIGR